MKTASFVFFLFSFCYFGHLKHTRVHLHRCVRMFEALAVLLFFSTRDHEVLWWWYLQHELHCRGSWTWSSYRRAHHVWKIVFLYEQFTSDKVVHTWLFKITRQVSRNFKKRLPQLKNKTDFSFSTGPFFPSNSVTITCLTYCCSITQSSYHPLPTLSLTDASQNILKQGSSFKWLTKSYWTFFYCNLSLFCC